MNIPVNQNAFENFVYFLSETSSSHKNQNVYLITIIHVL